MKKQTLFWFSLGFSCACVLIIWNASKLIGAEAKPRMKDLTFVPSPIVMRIMSMGHTNTVAKLRWIDSFSYMQYQFDRHDDTLIGESERGGFDRLYSALIDLDPYFLPFYEFAVASESLLREQGTLGMRCVLNGLGVMPHEMTLWSHLASCIKTYYAGKAPHALDSILTSWSRMAQSEEDQYIVNRWKQNLGTYHMGGGLNQLDYWCQQLNKQQPRSLLHRLAEETLRKQVAKYSVSLLQTLYDASSSKDLNACLNLETWNKAFPPDSGRAGAKIETAILLWGPFEFSDQYKAHMQDLLLKGQLQVHLTEIMAKLRTDPYGYPFLIKDNKVFSEGLHRERYAYLIKNNNYRLDQVVKEKQVWPSNLTEALTWISATEEFRNTPQYGTLKLEENHFRVVYHDQRELQPWPINDWAQYWIALKNKAIGLKLNH